MTNADITFSDNLLALVLNAFNIAKFIFQWHAKSINWGYCEFWLLKLIIFSAARSFRPCSLAVHGKKFNIFSFQENLHPNDLNPFRCLLNVSAVSALVNCSPSQFPYKLPWNFWCCLDSDTILTCPYLSKVNGSSNLALFWMIAGKRDFPAWSLNYWWPCCSFHIYKNLFAL